jgi:hypothetical protein
MNSSNKPYSEESQDDFIIREFKENLTQGDLIWHKDREDRLISPINRTDWMIQIDNELPKVIKENTFIPKEVFHRLLKGTGNLELKIVKNPQL